MKMNGDETKVVIGDSLVLSSCDAKTLVRTLAQVANFTNLSLRDKG